MQMQKQTSGRGLVPWAGVAVPVESSQADASGSVASGSLYDQPVDGTSALEVPQPLMGQAFCFLPLPCFTGVSRY